MSLHRPDGTPAALADVVAWLDANGHKHGLRLLAGWREHAHCYGATLWTATGASVGAVYWLPEYMGNQESDGWWASLHGRYDLRDRSEAFETKAEAMAHVEAVLAERGWRRL